jgi:DNA-binding transcriptional MerR regulator
MSKSAEAFRTISEVSEALGTPAHVLRFWESRFLQIRPIKRAGGRRYYRPEDVALLAGIRRLLYDDGLTIRGVQKILKEKGVRHVASLQAAVLPPPADLGAAETSRQPIDIGHMPGPADAPAPTGSAYLPAAPGPDRSTPTLPFATPLAEAPRPRPETLQPTEPARTPVTVPDRSGERVPAATLLRAMDALRARDKRGELTSVYRRLSQLRDRIAGEGEEN